MSKEHNVDCEEIAEPVPDKLAPKSKPTEDSYVGQQHMCALSLVSYITYLKASSKKAAVAVALSRGDFFSK